MEFQFRRSFSIIARIVSRVCKAIWELRTTYLELPSKTEQWKQIVEGFAQRWNMPSCIGMDGWVIRERI
jgi:hypothetical protein